MASCFFEVWVCEGQEIRIEKKMEKVTKQITTELSYSPGGRKFLWGNFRRDDEMRERDLVMILFVLYQISEGINYQNHTILSITGWPQSGTRYFLSSPLSFSLCLSHSLFLTHSFSLTLSPSSLINEMLSRTAGVSTMIERCTLVNTEHNCVGFNFEVWNLSLTLSLSHWMVRVSGWSQVGTNSQQIPIDLLWSVIDEIFAFWTNVFT